MKCPSCGAEVYPKSYLSHEIDGVPRWRRYLVFVSIFVAGMAVTMFNLIVRGYKSWFPTDYGLALKIALWESLGIAFVVFILAYYCSLIAKREKRFEATCLLALVFFLLFRIWADNAPRGNMLP